MPLALNKTILKPFELLSQDKTQKQQILSSQPKDINKEIKRLTKLMKQEAKKLNFQKAASLRDLILELEKTTQKN